MQWEEISNLATFLRRDGDIVLNGKCKLSLTSSILHALNDSFTNILNNEELFISSFHVLNSTGDMLDTFLDLHFLYDFFQKTVGLKLISASSRFEGPHADVQVFKNLRLLEVQRLSLSFVKGIKSLRAQLEYLTCMRSLSALKEVLENCGGDKSQGFVWSELKAAAFSHNSLSSVDGSFEFTPHLQSLDLSHNQLENVQQLNCLSNLKRLNLSFNKIGNVPSFTGGICDTLQVLILHHNFIDDIKELSLLNNLKQLDLAYNLLIDHNALTPLTNMAALENLELQGNPLCYHDKHRMFTACYLHTNAARNQLKLDNFLLNKREIRMLGSTRPSQLAFERSYSINSVTTENTVIQIEQLNNYPVRHLVFADYNQTSDMEVSTTSVASQTSEERLIVGHEEIKNTFLWQDGTTSIQDSQGMQDSGFVARPISPSECSIGSATSLSTAEPREFALRHCESDIEILSNPSQSSIEVLGSDPALRHVQSGATMTIIGAGNDLKYVGEELQRSL